MIQTPVKEKAYTKWTPELDDIIRTWDGKPQGLRLLSLKTDRTTNAIHRRLNVIGRTSFQKIGLTRTQIKLLRDMWDNSTRLQIKNELGVSYGVIYRAVEILGLEKNYERFDWYRISDLVSVLGMDKRRIISRINEGLLKAEVVRNDDDKAVHYKVRKADLIMFIRRYPYELTGRNVDMVFFVDLLTDGVIYDVDR